MKLGNIIKQLRTQNRITQTQLANMLNIKQSNISDWENGITRPEYENLIRLSVIFDTSIDYILDLKDEFGNDTAYYTSIAKQLGKDKK